MLEAHIYFHTGFEFVSLTLASDNSTASEVSENYLQEICDPTLIYNCHQ